MVHLDGWRGHKAAAHWPRQGLARRRLEDRTRRQGQVWRAAGTRSASQSVTKFRFSCFFCSRRSKFCLRTLRGISENKPIIFFLSVVAPAHPCGSCLKKSMSLLTKTPAWREASWRDLSTLKLLQHYNSSTSIFFVFLLLFDFTHLSPVLDEFIKTTPAEETAR